MKKIDLVYLWVDGSDAKWQAKKNAALKKAGIYKKTSATSANRWRDNDELKYSLRSAEKFAPWINHIYIVTDRQKPKWLKESARLSIINHEQIMEKKFLPNFNASAIEINIYKIPGLSEHFLYANDDMFFGRPVKPDFFFDRRGNPIVIMTGRNNWRAFAGHKTRNLFKTMKWNALRFVQRVFGEKYNLTFKHAIEPYRKSYMQEMADKFYKDIIVPSMTQFRDRANVQRVVLPLIDNAMGRNTIMLNWRDGKNRIIYNVHREHRFWHFIRWMFAALFGYIKYDCYDKQWRMNKIIQKRHPALFVINDTAESDADFIRTANLMNEMFPKKSQFEK
ncbi:MAG: Stealth CR1 domain-containing protein [Rickettsiales bacterium]|jgi:hypothetical protein|nr:Stealth CR1 domain-containing protein [Rickettsiales bacterium]